MQVYLPQVANQPYTFPLSELCPLGAHAYLAGKCEVSLSVKLRQGRHSVAARLSDASGSTVGKVSEATFHVMARSSLIWTESSCWSGWQEGGLLPSHSSCIAGDGPMQLHPCQHLSTWYPTHRNARALAEMESGLGDKRLSGGHCLCAEGSGPVALLAAVEQGAEDSLARLAGDGLSKGYEWLGSDGAPPPSLNKSTLHEVWVVWAQDEALAASKLYRQVPLFSAIPAEISTSPYLAVSQKELASTLKGVAETACLLRAQRNSKRSSTWVCMLVRDLLLNQAHMQAERQGHAFDRLGSDDSRTSSFLRGTEGGEDKVHGVGTGNSFNVFVLRRTALDTGSEVRYVVPQLYGLMGNILFKVAAALALAWELDAAHAHNATWKVLLPSPHNHVQCAKTWLSSVLSHPSVHRESLDQVHIQDWCYADAGPCHICHYPLPSASDVPEGGSVFLRGWRQSHTYFHSHRRRLIKAFSLPDHLEAAAQAKFRQLLATAPASSEGDGGEVETVSVHVRRGDLVGEGGTMLGGSYYEKALALMRGSDRVFFVFSDDIEWCRESGLFVGLRAVFVDFGIDFVELRLMAMCDRHIIANSTYSFWGAYLHAPPAWRRRQWRGRRWRRSQEGAPPKVVCPATWGRADADKREAFGEGDLYPESWTRIANDLV